MSLSNYEVARKFAERATPKVRKDRWGYLRSRGFSNSRGNVYTDGDNTEIYSYGTHFVMATAYDDKKLFIINGDRYSSTTSQHQSNVRGAIANHKPEDWKEIILPYTSLDRAGVRFETIEPIEILKDREIALCLTCGWKPNKAEQDIYGLWIALDNHKKDNPEHETHYEHRLGESVFRARVRGRGFTSILNRNRGWRKEVNEDRYVYFLSGFDITANHRGGYFLSALPRKVTSVDDAYEALKPKEVIEAESKGIRVLRQGDIFAIPTDYTTEELKQFKYQYVKAKREEYPSHKRVFVDWRNREKYAEKYPDQIAEHPWYIDREYWKVERPGVLGTDHTVGEMLTLTGRKPEVYARGSIRHNHNDNPPRPEHSVVYLAKGVWYRMVRNTSLGDWTVEGRVD